IFAGNAMNRRLFYQYGILLPPSPHGYVTQGLGLRVSAGSSGLIAPTVTISKPIEEIEVDGIKMIFQNTPNTEAPREMNTYIPSMKALWMAENVTGTLHNLYTLRGAQIRDPLTGRSILTRRCTTLARRPRLCLPRTTGRAGATLAFRRSCAPSGTCTPT